MSLAALESRLPNGRDTIVAMVCEHYILQPAEIISLQIDKDKPENHVNIIEHGAWKFCYHHAENTVFLL